MEEDKESPLVKGIAHIKDYDSSRLLNWATIAPPINPDFASEFYSRLTKWIGDFDKELEPQYEVGLRLVNFGQTFTFHLESIGYWNPSLISFHGTTDKGEPVELIQHVTQISILLMKVPRKNPDVPKKPIGFAIDTTERK
ncbi:MAG: DUF6173 family protein [Elusimicrobiota bacterium]|nr:DUF6173 family protein [Elusimicrobiota bacterium]